MFSFHAVNNVHMYMYVILELSKGKKQLLKHFCADRKKNFSAEHWEWYGPVLNGAVFSHSITAPANKEQWG